jgi:hypothetical protein
MHAIPANVAFIDMTPAAVAFAERHSRTALYSPSGHPSYGYHELIAEQIVAFLNSAGSRSIRESSEHASGGRDP